VTNSQLKRLGYSLVIFFRQVAGTKLLNIYISFETYFQKFANSTEKPKFHSSVHFRSKTMNSAAWSKIPQAAENSDP